MRFDSGRQVRYSNGLRLVVARGEVGEGFAIGALHSPELGLIPAYIRVFLPSESSIGGLDRFRRARKTHVESRAPGGPGRQVRIDALDGLFLAGEEAGPAVGEPPLTP